MEISDPTRQRITVQSTGQGPCVPSRAWHSGRHGSPGTFLRSFRPLLHVRTPIHPTQPDHRHKISTEPNQTGNKKRDSTPIVPRNPCLCRAHNPVRPLSLTGGSARRPPRLSEPDPGPDPHADGPQFPNVALLSSSAPLFASIKFLGSH
jgi:hypothetical protein